MPESVVGTKVHTHVRAGLAHMNGRPVQGSESKKQVSLTPSAALADVKKEFEFKRYAETYSRDTNGNTEYLILTGNTVDDLRLTIHSFSCYCEPLNENQEPPF